MLFYFHLGTMYVAMEFCVNGDLRSYLRKMKRCKNNLYANAKVISPVQKSVLLKFALEVASGLSHLADRQVLPVHARHAYHSKFCTFWMETKGTIKMFLMYDSSR